MNSITTTTTATALGADVVTPRRFCSFESACRPVGKVQAEASGFGNWPPGAHEPQPFGTDDGSDLELTHAVVRRTLAICFASLTSLPGWRLFEW